MSGVASLTTPVVVQAGEEILPENSIRDNAVIQNNDAAFNVVIKPDANPANDTDGIVLTPGEKQKVTGRNKWFAKSNNIAGTLIAVLETSE